MDGLLSALSLYDSFGALLSGMIALITCTYLNLPFLTIPSMDNAALETIVFIVASYFSGVVLLEVSIYMDDLTVRTTQKSITTYLNEGNDVVSDNLIYLNFKKIANEILEKERSNTIFTADEQRYVYYFCKNRVDMAGKGDGINLYNSWYAFSRSMMFLFPFVIVIYMICATTTDLVAVSLTNISVLCFLTALFYTRSKRLAAGRLSIVLQSYMELEAQQRLSSAARK